MPASAPDLVHTSDDMPGITRARCGRGFTYRGPDGTTIARGPERQRLEALAVPPAYQDVWYCPLPNGHLQATGRDTRARKQYRYHPHWSVLQAETKFASLIPFGEALPRLRRRVARDLQQEAGDHGFALAAAVTLIDRTAIRVGNPDYTRDNGSYGAVTLKSRHISLGKGEVRLAYRAKGGKSVRRALSDRRLARILGKINDLPGAELLSWVDSDGHTRSLGSAELNAYIAEAADVDGITAKTFRTWTGTLSAFDVAQAGGASIKAMSEAAAQALNNTATIARNSYIHPAVIDLANGDPLQIDVDAPRDLRVGEARLLSFLQEATG